MTQTNNDNILRDILSSGTHELYLKANNSQHQILCNTVAEGKNEMEKCILSARHSERVR